MSNHVTGDARNIVQTGALGGNVVFHASASFLELYQKAIDHLNADRPHTRMAGMRTLAELGQDHPDRRQAVVDAICAYLRCPYASDDAGELEVRRTTQHLLAQHLRPWRRDDGEPTNEAFWEGIHVNLHGAVLSEARFDHCEFAGADFEKARFVGDTRFTGARFRAEARFVHAVFDGWAARFSEAVFEQVSWFRWAEFNVPAEFFGTVFGRNAEFSRAVFRAPVGFDGLQVANHGWFTHIVFHDAASFVGASFASASFIFVHFEGPADFSTSRFTKGSPHCLVVRYENALPAPAEHHWPSGWTQDQLEPLPPPGQRTIPDWT